MEAGVPVKELGIDGNADLYGIGIRIGYYTAALSLWISHLWAQSEIHFLHPITLTFSVAVLVGVSVLSEVPSNTYAIEPFMMMQIAYYTYFMGLNRPHPPDLLQWENHYFSTCLTVFVGLCLHCWDTWFWWSGLYQMKPTPGTKTLGLFVYFGQADLYQWIKYPVRVYLTVSVIYHVWYLLTSLFRRTLERELNSEVPPSRLKELSEKWNNELGSQINIKHDDGLRQRALLSPPSVSRQPSKSSVKSAPVKTLPSDSGFDKEATLFSRSGLGFEWRQDDLKSQEGEKRGTGNSRSPSPQLPSLQTGPEGYQLERTGTGRLKARLLGWQPYHTYGGQLTHYYTPTFKAIVEAMDYLEFLNKPKKCNIALVILRYYVNLVIATARLIPVLFTHRVRPRVLLAILVHMRTLSYTREDIYPTTWRLAIHHPAYNHLQAEDIALASRIIVTLKPLRKPKKVELWLWSYALFMTCALLVIGTELAIQWNEIRNVQNLKTVGQLIPAAIGVGGLIKVIWTALFENTETARLCYGRCRGDKKRQEWIDACEVYEKAYTTWKSRTDEGSGSPKKEIDV